MSLQVKKHLIIADTDKDFIEHITKELSSFYHIKYVSSVEELEKSFYLEDLEMILISESFPAASHKNLLDRLFSFKTYPWVFTVKILDTKTVDTIATSIEEGFHFVMEKELSSFQLLATLLSLHKLQNLSNRATRLIHQFKGQAEKDPLTNLFNRTVFFDYSHREFSRSKRNDFPLSVLMIDIDYFKNINDQYGHLGGDTILIEFASFLTKHLRKYDFISRFGGDEFIITLPHTTLEQARQVGEKLREKLSKTLFCYSQQDIQFTISLGVASLSDTPSPQSLKQLISYADEALYKAKNTGRNRLCTYKDLSS